MIQGKTTKILLVILGIVMVGVAAYYFLPSILAVFMPFIIAYIIAAMIEPLVRLLSQKLKIPRSIASAICVFLTIIVVSGAVYFLIFRIIAWIIENWEAIRGQAQMYWEQVDNLYKSQSPETQGYLDKAVEAIQGAAAAFFKPVTDGMLNFAKGIPGGIIFCLVMFLAAYFISSQKNNTKKLSQRIFGAAISQRVSSVVRDLKHALGGYVKAQLIIMSIVFAILLIGLWVVGAPYLVFIAMCIAIFDALPVLGSGGILLPWSLISFINGNMRSGIILLIIYFVILATRQMIEPKIIGKQIGVPPLITLISMYAGLRFFGIFGMILGPVLVLLIKNLYEAGIFDRLLRFGEGNQNEQPENTEDVVAVSERNDNNE